MGMFFRAASRSAPAPAVGCVPFTLVVLSAVLVLIPATRPGGLVGLVVLAIPALVVWARARKLTDGSRGLTTSTLVIGVAAFILAGALSAGPQQPRSAADSTPSEPAPPTTTAPVAPPAVAPSIVQPTPGPQQVASAPQPLVEAPAQTAPAIPAAPQPAPAPRVTTDESSGTFAYYKNCAEARAAGAAPIHRGQPGYRAALDRDNDGVACE